MVRQGLIARAARKATTERPVRRGRPTRHVAPQEVHRAAVSSVEAMDDGGDDGLPLVPTAHLPRSVRAAMSAGDKFAVVSNLRECIFSAHSVMHLARRMQDANGAKLLIIASEHLRKCLDTLLRLQDQVYEMAKIDAFFQQLIDLVRRENPAVAAQLMEQLESLTVTWRVEAGAPPPRQ